MRCLSCCCSVCAEAALCPESESTTKTAMILLIKPNLLFIYISLIDEKKSTSHGFHFNHGDYKLKASINQDCNHHTKQGREKNLTALLINKLGIFFLRRCNSGFGIEVDIVVVIEREPILSGKLCI